MLARVPRQEHPDLIVGSEFLDDAGVFKLSDEMALVQTVDFLTPIVDDPHLFGQIAAANALSDVYAMGARPVTAMNIVCFPTSTLDLSILEEILAGGAEKVGEAGAIIVGGHTVEDKEPKYGLAVTGLVSPRRVVTNAGAKPGDRLVLTKPLGAGIISTALKGGVIEVRDAERAWAEMAALNKEASEAMVEVGVNACTDITGFGLLGHIWEMASASGVAVEVDVNSVPVLDKAYSLAAMGLVPAGGFRNRKFLEPYLAGAEAIPDEVLDVLCDPQTSGGLLIAVSEGKHGLLLERLRARGVEGWVIGTVGSGPPQVILRSG